jgi:hypothetical protein
MNAPYLIEWTVLLPYRIRLRWNKRGRKRQRDAAIHSIRNLVEKSGTLFSHSRRIHNVSLYALILDQDIAMLTDDMVLAVGQQRRVFVARNLAVLLYEASQDLPDLLGRDYRESLRTLTIPDTWLDELNKASKQLNRFKDEHREFLGRIRNLIGAHRDKDAITQLEAMETLEPIDVMRLAAKLQEPLNLLINLQIKLTLHVGDMSILGRDLFSNPQTPSNDASRRNTKHRRSR